MIKKSIILVMLLWIPFSGHTEESYPKIRISSNGDTTVEISYRQFLLTTKLLVDRERLLINNSLLGQKVKSYEMVIASKDKQIKANKLTIAAKDTIIKNMGIMMLKETKSKDEYKSSYETAVNNLKKQKRRSKLFGSFFGIIGGCLAGTIAYIAVSR